VLLVMFLGYSLSNRAPRKQRLPIRIASLVLPIVGLIIFWLASGWGYLAWDLFSHLVLPVLTLTLWIYAGTMLLMRTSMLDTLGEDYILTARAKGIAGNVVRDRHAARNALLPVWTSLVFGIVASIGGGIIIEKAFSWPGIGLAFLNASLSEDIPLAMGILTILGVMALLGHLIVDLGYVFLDPRIRYS
jgi:peptide/nickel transport system permease protein